MQLQNKVAIVTGAAVGTGRALARRLAAEGSSVVLTDVDVEEGRHTQQLIQDGGGRSTFIPADMRRREQIEDLIARTAVAFGSGPQVLVNNAGGGGHIPPHFPEAPMRDWVSLMDLNLRGAMHATQLVLTPMRRSGGGAVLNIGSSAGLGLRPHQSPEYAAAKAGLMRFTSTLDHLQASMQIRVNCLVPDWVLTERAQRELAKMPAQQREQLSRPIPMTLFTDAAIRLITDDSLAGRVMELLPGSSGRLIN